MTNRSRARRRWARITLLLSHGSPVVECGNAKADRVLAQYLCTRIETWHSYLARAETCPTSSIFL